MREFIFPLHFPCKKRKQSGFFLNGLLIFNLNIFKNHVTVINVFTKFVVATILFRFSLLFEKKKQLVFLFVNYYYYYANGGQFRWLKGG